MVYTGYTILPMTSTYRDPIAALDAATIASAKAHLEECKKAEPKDYAYMLGGCEELIRQLIRVAERNTKKAK